MKYNNYNQLVKEVGRCTFCAPYLPCNPRPVIQIHPAAKVLIAGQAPGRKVYETGIPFNDASGERLRSWMGVNADVFYDPREVAILPMGFCYPGTGKNGDLPPRKECAEIWRKKLLSLLPNIQLTLVIGQYALDWHLGDQREATLTDTVKNWNHYWPDYLPLPHPSPRNNIWFKKNEWFEIDVLPTLKHRINELIQI